VTSLLPADEAEEIFDLLGDADRDDLDLGLAAAVNHLQVPILRACFGRKVFGSFLYGRGQNLIQKQMTKILGPNS
jgi:hypothetical protein